jgi:hypothetical protein
MGNVTGTIRDVAIIVLAIESILIGVLLAVLVIQVIRLVRLLRQEVLPILNSTQETVSTVRGTATFVSDHLVQPVVKVASYSAGVRQALNALLRFRHRDGRKTDEKEA